MVTVRDKLDRVHQLEDRVHVFSWLEEQLQPYLNEESQLRVEDRKVAYDALVSVRAQIDDLKRATILERETLMDQEVGDTPLAKEAM